MRYKVADNNRKDILENDLKEYPAVLDPDTVAEILGVSKKTINNMITAGRLVFFALDPTKERKQYRITKADLIAYMLDTNSINE